MNKETQRIIIASILITLVAYFYPNFWYVDNSLNNSAIEESIPTNDSFNQKEKIIQINNQRDIKPINNIYENKTIIVSNKLHSTTISNIGGGTIIDSKMIEKRSEDYKYLETLDANSADDNRLPVRLHGGACNPCLAYYDDELKQYQYINDAFNIITPNINTEYFLNENDTLIIEFQYVWNNMKINKIVEFYGNSYESIHHYKIDQQINNKFEIIWVGGMHPIDQEDFEQTTGNAMIGQSDETESIKITDKEKYIERQEYNGNTNWASIRTKYFIAALLDDKNADYATMSGYIDDTTNFPSYTVGLGYYNSKQMKTSIYLGPLDIDYIGKLNNTLDDTINFGFTIVRPIGKFVLWFLKIIHNTFNLNYGICLIIFAIIIQILTSPLTKKMYESSQKMQKIQPLVKKIQDKYKSDPQKMNQEVMNIYREKGVNPLGGCLPLLLQMPLLMAIFSVFRDTIEFRNANFMLWITDLSKPDILFHLPFNIPLYGDHVAFLPILMGISIFLTQKLSMATMDPAQKPLMYVMNGFFILIFNGFPSGLNLYYTVYNLLNYYQQKRIRTQN